MRGLLPLAVAVSVAALIARIAGAGAGTVVNRRVARGLRVGTIAYTVITVTVSVAASNSAAVVGARPAVGSAWSLSVIRTAGTIGTLPYFRPALGWPLALIVAHVWALGAVAVLVRRTMAHLSAGPVRMFALAYPTLRVPVVRSALVVPALTRVAIALANPAL